VWLQGVDYAACGIIDTDTPLSCFDKTFTRKIVSERLGHSTVSITLDLYSHVLPGMQEEVAEMIDSAIRLAMLGVQGALPNTRLARD
jgi:integrase